MLRGSHPIYQQLQALPHPYLPKILQVEQHQDGMTLLEEYIDGANLAEITESRYPDEPLLLYTTSGDYIIAKVGDLRHNGQSLSMALDLDGDGLKESVELFGLADAVYGNLTVGTEDGNWMDLIG